MPITLPPAFQLALVGVICWHLSEGLRDHLADTGDAQVHQAIKIHWFAYLLMWQAVIFGLAALTRLMPDPPDSQRWAWGIAIGIFAVTMTRMVQDRRNGGPWPRWRWWARQVGLAVVLYAAATLAVAIASRGAV